MKKIIKLLCLLAVFYVAYLVLIQPGEEGGFAIEGVKAGVDNIVDRVTGMYGEYGPEVEKQVDDALSDKAKQADSALEEAVEQADEALENVAEEADDAIAAAVDSAVEGAKQGFLQSIRESVDGFLDRLSQEEEE